jgi:hypothetical protein
MIIDLYKWVYMGVLTGVEIDENTEGHEGLRHVF